MSKRLLSLALLLLILFFGSPALSFQVSELSEDQKKILDENFRTVLARKKGPYSPNYCVCADGEKKPVLGKDGKVANRCGTKNTRFCAAFRNEWAEAIGAEGMYVGNIFAPDLFDWDKFPDKHDLVRGYVLEKFFVDTHPEHKLAEMKAYGGLSGAEYEARDMPLFFEAYLSEEDFNDSRHFILVYELQKRFFVRNDWGEIQKIRNLASRIYGKDRNFKPLRDSTHNQVSGSLVPRLEAYRDKLKKGSSVRKDIDALITEIQKLTSLDETALAPQLAELQEAAVREKLQSLLPATGESPVDRLAALGKVSAASRTAVAAGEVSAADRRRLVDINVTLGAVVQSLGSKLVEEAGGLSVGDHLRLLGALVDASYGTGLLTPREREAAQDQLTAMLERDEVDRDTFRQDLKKVERVVEWAHNGAMLAFGEVWAPWTHLLPDVIHIGDDIVRGSPMLLLAQVSRRLDDHLAGENPVRHSIFGKEFTTEVRALNPGLSLGTLKVAPKEGGYGREDLLALPETPADLKPAAGIVTRGEGNVVSHVQLLARALGIPNSVVANEVYDGIAPHDGKEIFMVVTPGGRVYLKAAADMEPTDQPVYDDFNRNSERSGDGALTGGEAKLHIDKERLNVTDKEPLDLETVGARTPAFAPAPRPPFLVSSRTCSRTTWPAVSWCPSARTTSITRTRRSWCPISWPARTSPRTARRCRSSPPASTTSSSANSCPRTGTSSS